MKTQLRKLTQGFTIIEVMIVLAIAGLIMAIIFLAVPALQRNTHNNSRRSDAAHLAGIVNEYAANHAGALPTGAQLSTAVTAEQWAIMSPPVAGDLSAAVAAPANNVAGTLGTLHVYTGGLCTASAGTVSSSGAGSRSFAIEYNVEAGGAATGTATCVQG